MFNNMLPFLQAAGGVGLPKLMQASTKADPKPSVCTDSCLGKNVAHLRLPWYKLRRKVLVFDYFEQ